MTVMQKHYESFNKASRRKGETNDCSVIALAAVCAISYDKAHKLMYQAGRRNRDGAYTWQTVQAIKSLGYDVEVVKTKHKTFGQVEKAAAKGKMPGAYLLCGVRHIAGMRRGELCDWTSRSTGRSGRNKLECLLKVIKRRSA